MIAGDVGILNQDVLRVLNSHAVEAAADARFFNSHVFRVLNLNSVPVALYVEVAERQIVVIAQD